MTSYLILFVQASRLTFQPKKFRLLWVLLRFVITVVCEWQNFPKLHMCPSSSYSFNMLVLLRVGYTIEITVHSLFLQVSLSSGSTFVKRCIFWCLLSPFHFISSSVFLLGLVQQLHSWLFVWLYYHFFELIAYERFSGLPRLQSPVFSAGRVNLLFHWETHYRSTWWWLCHFVGVSLDHQF